MPSQLGLKPRASYTGSPGRYVELPGISADAEGNLVLPAAALTEAGLDPGGEWACALVDGRVTLMPDALSKVYVEATALCNLSCVTCIRHAWDEPMGHMQLPLYRKLLDGLPAHAPDAVTFAFAGYGEPLVHPQFLELVELARTQGLRAEIITNGLLLTAERIRELLRLGVAQVAVSVDGGDEATYGDVRGNGLAPVLANLQALAEARRRARVRLRLGIAFVATRRNVASLPDLLRIATELELDFVSISNVVPHTPEMAAEALWGRAAWAGNFAPHTWRPRLEMARLDMDDVTRPVVADLWQRAPVFPPPAWDAGAWRNHCRFVHEGTLAVSWDGRVAPCLSLLHSHPEYIYGHWKNVRRYDLGHIGEEPLADIWRKAEYRDFRRRLRAFDFPECFLCGGCPSTEGNEEDCFGNSFPVCSECLWAQGLVVCP
jgi:MoaA/NifB/PqqE/SkfB family radical SAM enzyme